MRIALYQPDIPQNTGNIFRLGACLGVSVDIIEPTGFIFDDKRLKRVAMDYMNKSKIVIYRSYENFLKKKKDSRVILMSTKAKKKYTTFKFKSNDTILFGRESAGVPKKIHKMVNNRLKIPLSFKKRSLNLSSSVAITLAESLRQNKLI